MKISWMDRETVGRFGFRAEPEAYDGVPPVCDLYVDRDILMVNNDLVSLAGFLAFGSYCGGSVTLPRKISPELARAMERFVDPLWLQPSPVEMEPMRAPEGDGFAFVSDRPHLDPILPNTVGKPRNLTITILDASVWSGDLVATDRLVVASNAATFAKFVPSTLKYTPIIGAALLYLESYKCTTIVVPDDAIEDESTWQRTATLLNACKLGLLRESEAGTLLGSSDRS